jgi:hypothetical protein
MRTPGIGSWGQGGCSSVQLGLGITGRKGGGCMPVSVFGFYFFIGNFRRSGSISEATIKQKILYQKNWTQSSKK